MSVAPSTGATPPSARLERRAKPWEPALLRPPRRMVEARRSSQPALLRRPTTLGLLIVFVALQFLIPARLVVSGMGAVGRPSVAVGLLLLFLWILTSLRRAELPVGFQPVRWIIGGWIALQLFGYAVAYDRGLPVIEASRADRWLILTLAMAGLALAIADGIANRRQLDRLLRVLVGLTAVMGAVGVLQFVGIVDLTQYIRIPGLSLNADLIGVGQRGGPGFPRVASTASHFIEFGVVAAMVLPLALHYAFFAKTRRQQVLRWVAVALIAVAIPFSISRSATLAVGVAMVLMATVWQWRHRLNVAVAGALALGAFHTVQRGVLGTIRSLFENAEYDPSVQDRIARTEKVRDLVEEGPWVGRGAGTFLPETYFLLDNQLYMTLIEGGLVGITALFALFYFPYLAARSLRLRGVDQETRHLAQAMAVVMPVALVTSATFDSFSFPTFVGVVFTVIGAIGALWRLDGGGEGRRPLQFAAPGDKYVASPWMAGWRTRSESQTLLSSHARTAAP